MGMPCEQESLSDSKCQMDASGMDDKGYCGVEGADFPGDGCDCYQPDLAGDYCERCGNYLGYEDEDDDFSEESECICD